MKHIVREISTATYATLAKHEFNTAEEAFDYAWTMNQLMKRTPIRYIYGNKVYHLYYTNSRGNTVHKQFHDVDDATAFTAILDKRIERGTCFGYSLST